jgi:hypothetical protein
MENNAGKIVWTVGAQMLALALGLLTVFLIVWAASKAWKKGQAESSWNLQGDRNWLATGVGGSQSGYSGGQVTGYAGSSQDWLGY